MPMQRNAQRYCALTGADARPGPAAASRCRAKYRVEVGHVRILDIRGVRHIGAYHAGVVRKALRQGPHMREARHEVLGILQQRRRGDGHLRCAPRHAAQGSDAFGHQVGVAVEFGGERGKEGLQREEVCPLDVPEGLLDVGPEHDGTGQGLLQQRQHVEADFQGHSDPCGMEKGGITLVHGLSLLHAPAGTPA